jgi:hypothetical protein
MNAKTKKLLEALGAKNLTEAGVRLLNPYDFDLPEIFEDAELHLEGRQVEEFIEAIKPIAWNQFDGERVAEAIRKLHQRGAIMELEVTKDTILITPPFWTSQASNYKGDPKNGRKLTEEERRGLFYLIKATLADANPDELDFVTLDERALDWKVSEDLPDGDLTHVRVRAWWD